MVLTNSLRRVICLINFFTFTFILVIIFSFIKINIFSWPQESMLEEGRISAQLPESVLVAHTYSLFDLLYSKTEVTPQN
jgi:hypothetical protein